MFFSPSVKPLMISKEESVSVLIRTSLNLSSHPFLQVSFHSTKNALLGKYCKDQAAIK